MGFARTILVAVLWSASAFAAATDPPVRELCRHGDLVRWVGYSPDGRIVASAGFDGAIRWTHLGSGNPLKVLPGSDKKVWGAFSAVGTTFAAGSWDPTVRVWVAPVGTLRQALTSPHTAAWAGAMSSDGKTLVSGGPEGMIAWWDAKLGVATHTIQSGSAVWWLSLSPAGDEVAAGCQDGKIRVFGRDSTDPRIVFAEHVGGVYGVA
jgi:WD40 repeat protein